MLKSYQSPHVPNQAMVINVWYANIKTLITTQQKIFMSRLGCFLDNFWPLNPNLASCFSCCQYFSRYLQSYIYFFSKYLISQIFLLTYITTFEPETPAGHPKYQKTRVVA